MAYNLLSFNGSFHQICHKLADDFHLPIPYVSHLVFLELYKRNIDTAIAFFVESDLFGFFLKRKGELTLYGLIVERK